MPMPRSIPRRALLMGVVCANLALTAPAGAAAATTTLTTACGTAALSQPFVPWGDAGLYSLIPGGGFEGSPTGWTLAGGAQTVAGSEPYGATGSVGARSLSLPAGASARSPFFCVTSSDHTFRLFVLNHLSGSSVLVQAILLTPAGRQITLSVGTLSGDSTWTPSAIMHTGAALITLLSGSPTGRVALQFTATGGASQIDDLFVDPRMKA